MTTSEQPDVDPDVFASGLLTAPAPTDAFPAEPTGPRQAYQLVHDELMLDGVARMNLATFCTTWAEDEVHRLMDQSLSKNIVDKDEYPQTAEIERRCVRMLADLFHAPDPATATGTSTTGSSEAAMLAGLAAKWRWRNARQAAGRPTGTPNLVCGPVQVCWEKFARYFDVELRECPMPPGWVATPEQLVAACDENTIAVVVTFGQTFTGLFEDVAGVCAALDELQERKGWDIPVHVDAASGGFLGAFCAPDLAWDFRQPRVRSINASGHKTGLAPLGVGWALWRDRESLPDELVFNVNYLGGQMPTFNLNFSRPGGQVVSSYYNFIRLGRAGYTAVQQATYAVAQRLADGLREMGGFELLFDANPDRGIAAVTWTTADHSDGASLYELAHELRARGWLVPAYSLPPDQEQVIVQRAVIRHGVTEDMIEALLVDLRRSRDAVAGRSGPARATFTHDATPLVPQGNLASGSS